MIPKIKTFGLLTAPGGVLVLITMFRKPSEADAAIVLGFSIQRLVLVLAVLVLMLALLFLAWRADKLAGWVEHHTRRLDILWSILFGMGWLTVWTPSYRLGALSGYFERVYPLLAWTLWLAAIAIALRVADKGLQWDSLKSRWREHPALWRAAVVSLGMFLLLWAWIGISGIGLKRDIDMWNEGGVPVLGLQVLFGLGLAGMVFLWERRLNGEQAKRRFDAGLFILIWLVAAFIWWQEPILRSYFLPRPVAPNFEYYPFSDAAVYDMGGQQVLLGHGIHNGVFSDKPMYMMLLAIFHVIGGQSYEGVILVQVLAIALYPAVLYLIGRHVHSRAAGMMIAALAVFKEKNAIAAVLAIQVTHSKLMMSEMPTALALSVFTLLGILWFKRKDNFTLPLWAGGLLGIAVLIRPTPALIVPVPLVFSLFLYGRRQMKQWLVASATFGLGLALVMGPWFGFTQSTTGGNYLIEKIERVLKRFKIHFPSDGSSLDPGFAATVMVAKPDLMPLPPQSLEIVAVAQRDTPGMGYLVASHFWHNEITSMVIFPSTFLFHDLKQVIAQPPWVLGWEGELSLENWLFLLFNLTLLALGIGVAWNRMRWAGLLPLLIHLAYNLANAFGRTSGSRYIVPVDWVLFIYYSLGILQLIAWVGILLEKPGTTGNVDAFSNAPADKNVRTFLVSSGILLLIGLSLSLNKTIIPQQFVKQPSEVVLQELEDRGLEGLLAEKGIRLANVRNLVKRDKRVVLLHGIAFYPRYFDAMEGGCSPCFMMDDAYRERKYSRLTFTMASYDYGAVNLALATPPEDFPNAVEVFVFGCNRKWRKAYDLRRIDALFVLMVSENGDVLYSAQPGEQPLNCKP